MTNDQGFDRRKVVAGAAALLASPAVGQRRARGAGNAFPQGFLWGAATAGHQVEGNNVNSDQWLLEQVRPTITGAPSSDAVNSLELWPADLDLVKAIGLNAYRFSLEWARIEPEPGHFSMAMLDHYKAMIDGCQTRGITPVVTFNHYSAPRWFAARGGWLSEQAPGLFARFCERAAGHLAAGIGIAQTLNEPNIGTLLKYVLPPQFVAGLRANLAAAAKAAGSASFAVANTVLPEHLPVVTRHMLAGHKAARNAIKSARPELPVGVSLAVLDDQAVGENSLRDAKRSELYGVWLDAVKQDDFVGVQNYERAVWDDRGKRPPPPGVPLSHRKAEVYPASLGGAVRYAHALTGVPILVSEHGVGTPDDRIRAWMIPLALRGLKEAMDDGVPVLGYIHWSLLDNYQWGVGLEGGGKVGLASVERPSFKRTAKPSASVLGAIARRNAL